MANTSGGPPMASTPGQGVGAKGKKPQTQGVGGAVGQGLQAANPQMMQTRAQPAGANAARTQMLADQQKAMGQAQQAKYGQGAFGYSNPQLNQLEQMTGGTATAATRGQANAVDQRQAQLAALGGGPNEFNQMLTKQFGEGNPFGPQSWYGGNPLETAQALANRNLGKNLADIRARYGASGFGNSAREALAEGEAAGEAATGLGDVMAARGIGARSDDLGRLANMLLGSGQQNLQAQQLGLQANQQLLDAGQGITGVGAGEQQIPNATLLLSLLGLTGRTQGRGTTSQSGQTGSGFLGM